MDITPEFLESIGFLKEISRGNKYCYREITWFNNSKELWLGMRKLHNVTTRAEIILIKYLLGSEKNDFIKFSFSDLFQSLSEEFGRIAKHSEIRSDIAPETDQKIKAISQHLKYAADCAKEVDQIFQ